jgi:hypothetical protein
MNNGCIKDPDDYLRDKFREVWEIYNEHLKEDFEEHEFEIRKLIFSKEGYIRARVWLTLEYKNLYKLEKLQNKEKYRDCWNGNWMEFGDGLVCMDIEFYLAKNSKKQEAIYVKQERNNICSNGRDRG